MATIDLDAARIARAEITGDAHFILFGGQKFELPAELAFDFFLLLADGDLKQAVGELLGDQLDEFWAHRPTDVDLKELMKQVAAVYGMGTPGESRASGRSSSPSGSHSRPTSPGTTASISDEPVSGGDASGSGGSRP